MKTELPVKSNGAEITENLNFNQQNLNFSLYISNISKSEANQLDAMIR